ncbi:alpha/beta fold hydrolase [Lentibacter algarum]|uniref:alpha/beta fold hydrolase n=1 Tax=Lentibacter algarum TaxID=576131 RepID=UPI001C065A0A|nr:alpha/beta fold hydrolase [Lentibacter algarum]MBU2981763.1 alpha/beta fold hydrolase [Lentibacter algarum]
MLNFIRHGTKTEKPPLLIAHGLFGSARNWGVIAKRLSSEREVIVVDMRNHGSSPWSDTHTYEAMASDLAEVITAELDGNAHVLGHSMGGKAVMVLALKYPECVGRLTVADIAPVPYGHSQQSNIDAMLAVDLDAIETRQDALRALEPLVSEASLAAFFTQSLDVKARKWRLNLEALAKEMPNVLAFPDCSGDPAFAGPVLFLSGANSDYVQPEHRSVIKPLFPAARFAKIPDAGHWLHAENPRAFVAALEVWLNAA